MPGCKRLHITPLNPEALSTVLPPTILQQATKISFHTIQTFPEKNYGYVDLPEVEADKLKKKLHGSVLRGSKMRVEEARSKKAPRVDDEDKALGLEGSDTKTKRSRKVKVREEGVLPGHELQDRKVTRGWTEPGSSEAKPAKRSKEKADKKSKTKPASITGEAELLFKTTLPQNATSAGKMKDGRVKKRKRGESSREVVVHEFVNTTKHANFLRDESNTKGKNGASEYVEGKGWVDEDGNVVEAEPKARRTKAKQDGSKDPRSKDEAKPPSRRSSRLELPSVQVTAPKTRSAKTETAVVDDETSSSGSSSSSDSESEDEVSEAPPSPPKTAKTRGQKQRKSGRGAIGTEDGGVEVGSVERLSITRSSASPPPVQRPGPTSVPAKEVHPLETLFKRPNNAASRTPKKPALEVSTSFNFFDPDTEEGGSQGLLMPQTPFTQQDIRQRRQRSAAPTPDTAAPGKTFGDIWEGTSDISDDEDDTEVDDTPKGKAKKGAPEVKEEQQESEFSKWFWEHRGETNRAWKKRRRETAKDKRQKDNKERRG
ncbi:hypothetical protein OEA41_004148 [Lepraria neglecta]|uniref:Uncharacterized protein n=1 Tax=Lepraria neglecta TaxID=209136 RepID=A0AAD9Z5K0_9LECA|nr:hypothetical protein OEA41_004148 [Lepraria neglecta]